MFEITKEELGHLGVRFKDTIRQKYMPYVFTENGVAMLSSILNCPQAIQINIAIMRTFTKLRSFLAMEASLSERMNRLEQSSTKLFRIVFERLDTIDETIMPKLSPNRKKIGLKRHE